MKYLALMAFALLPASTVPGVLAGPGQFYVIEVTEHQCAVEGEPVSCAYILALYNKLKANCHECRWQQQEL